jgi:hypothetical protein
VRRAPARVASCTTGLAGRLNVSLPSTETNGRRR